MTKPHNILWTGGPILTMEEGPAPEAVLTSEGRIAAVGSLSALEAIAPSADRRDLQGRCLLPAFVDSHSHITALAATLDLCQLGAAGSFDDILSALKDFRHDRDIPPGGWVVGFGYDHNVLDERSHPTKEVLDRAFPDCPVLITHASGHMGVANSAALRSVGICAGTPDPSGGRIGRSSDGRTPSGYLEEAAFHAVSSAIPSPAPAEAVKNLKRAEEVYLSHGITLVQDGLTDQSRYTLLSGAGLTVDVIGYADMAGAPELAGRPGIGGYKIFLDGSPQGRTAWMLQPYAGSEDGYCGYPAHTDEAVTAFVAQALREGRQILAHCNGDAAAEQYLRCTARAAVETGLSPASIRPVMIHAQLVRRDQLARMADLSIIPSFFAAHLWYWGDVHMENFGPDRAATISPLRWAADLGLPFTLHQDTPVIAPDMLESVWCAVSRLTRKGRVLAPELRISPLEALRAVTIHAARQYFLEQDRGSIAVGKRADFVVLNADPVTAPPAGIRDIQVLETVKNGEPVWSRECPQAKFP